MLQTIFIVCGVVNFTYAALHGHTWDTALERTFFQGEAIFIVFLVQWFMKDPKETKTMSELDDKLFGTVPPKPMREPQRGDPDWIESIDG